MTVTPTAPRPATSAHSETGQSEFVSFRDLAPDIPSTTHATFGLYRYPAKFIPQVVSYTLRRYGAAGESVIDPFAGYGTVGTVARTQNNPYELWDLNPLMPTLHQLSIMQPPDIEPDALVRDLKEHAGEFQPAWRNLDYWHHQNFLPMLGQAWSFYHSLPEGGPKSVLLVPLLKATQQYSFNDEKRQKLSQSPLSRRRIEKLLEQDWRTNFYRMLGDGMKHVLKAQHQYHAMAPAAVESNVRGGVNTLTQPLEREHDLLLTSPPYMQAQEYIRRFKMDLLWLGKSEDEVRELGRMEMPYQRVEETPIHSATYEDYLKRIQEPHLRLLYQRYFWGVFGALTRLQENIRRYLLLFVGPASVRGMPIPISQIAVEHFSHIGWRHKTTLVDNIVSRAMFFYRANPATGEADPRMTTEHLVVLERPR